jgi:CBS domain-containing protein
MCRITPLHDRRQPPVLNDRVSTLRALTPPIVVETGTSVGELMERIRHHRVGCVLVTTGGRLAGIITERDILLKVVARDVPYSEPVDQFMTREPIVLDPDKTVGDAINIMNEYDFRHVPVVGADGEAHGIVSIKDVIDLVAESFPQQVLNLPPRPHQKMEEREGG